jgi:hypothetical protein
MFMEERWHLRSFHNREEEWKSVDQIDDVQIRLINNLFGMNFRILPMGDGHYRIADFDFIPFNIYIQIMREKGINFWKACEEIKEQIESADWTAQSLRLLLDYGIIEGISTKLQVEDKKNNFETDYRGQFLSNKDIEMMRKIEWYEYFYCLPSGKTEVTDEEKLDFAKRSMDSDPTPAAMLMYEKYKRIIEDKKKAKDYGARVILEFVKNHDLTEEDLILALSMLKDTETDIREEEYNVNAKGKSKSSR